MQYRDGMKTYLEQLNEHSAALGVNLSDACKAEGVALTTLARWRKAETTVREGTFKALYQRISLMAKAERSAA